MNEAPLLADLPLEERRQLEVERQRELAEGTMRSHVEVAEYQQHHAAVMFARALAVLPTICAKLRAE